MEKGKKVEKKKDIHVHATRKAKQVQILSLLYIHYNTRIDGPLMREKNTNSNVLRLNKLTVNVDLDYSKVFCEYVDRF